MGAADRTDAEVDELMDVSAKKRAEVDALWAKLNGGGGSSDASAAASKAPAKGGRGRGAKKAAATTTDDDSHSGPGPSKGRAALDVIARLNRVAGGAVAKKGDTKSTKKALNDSDWRKSLGLDGDAKPKKPTAKVSADAVREALAKAGGGVRMRAMERTDGVMKVTETRNFAGKEMEVTKLTSREPRRLSRRRNATRRPSPAAWTTCCYSWRRRRS
jgi:hypothetical protein